MIAARAAPPALDQLWSYIGRAYYNYKLLLERTLRELELDGTVSPGMGHILFTLFEREGCIIREIAEKTRLSFPTITVVLQRMKKAGLVELRPDPDDGRAVRVRLSELGRSIEPRCWRVVRRLNAVLEKGLSRKDVAVAKRALARMVENMREDEARSGG
jgi:DNA-binding MarR family transcriptional regulator